jgi:hypothetical protein
MIKRIIIFPFLILLLMCCGAYRAEAQSKNLKLIFIRHAEKPADGDNLSCMGLNRALKLPEVLKAKFGPVNHIYIPSMHPGKSTSRGRMFQTVSPFAIKYNLAINSRFEEEDVSNLAAELQGKKGTILIVWEHSYIKPAIKALGINKGQQWPNDDFDSIWIVTYKKGQPTLTLDKEGIKPEGNCSF